MENLNRKEQFIKLTRQITEISEIQNKYAEHLCELFNVIDPKKIGAEFIDAVAREDYIMAVNELAKYFRQKPYNTLPNLSANGDFERESADRTVSGHVREIGIDWHFKDGEFDFFFDPTKINKPQNNEWQWQLGRHSYWTNMARTYVATKDEKYALGFKKQLLKWIAQTYIPQNWNGAGSAWRTIECGIRLLGSWQVAYDGFRRSESICDVSLLLMIASMHRQSIHIVNNPTRANWLLMEMNGVYTFSAIFPELTDSEKNRMTATQYLITEFKNQILPDGMHNELSPDYHSVAFNCACNFYSLAKELGYSHEIPDSLRELICKMVDAIINLSTPAHTQPKTNDCYSILTKVFTNRASLLFGDTSEYRYFNTNRISGEPPKGETASRYLPYAGFAVMRSDWGEDATYMCFDVGPLGMGHVHWDKLNINLYKGNEELLFDDGGGQYDESEARKYALTGYDHNTILVDGMSQYRVSPSMVEEEIDISWVSNSEYDYASATYDDTFGKDLTKPATHKREIRFCKPDFFCVTDTLVSVDGKPHDYEVLFHLDTTKVSSFSNYKNAIISDFGRNYELVMIPLDCECQEPILKSVSAVTKPQMRGWYNGRNDSNLHEAITVSREVKGVENYKFTTLLFPVRKEQKMPVVKKNDNGTITVSFNGKDTIIDIEMLDK